MYAYILKETSARQAEVTMTWAAIAMELMVTLQLQHQMRTAGHVAAKSGNLLSLTQHQRIRSSKLKADELQELLDF